MAEERDEVLWLQAGQRVTIVELSEACGVPVPGLQELVEYGALVPADEDAATFDAHCVAALRDAARLCADLELELPAMALLLRFLDRIHDLESQVRHLHARLPR